MEKVNDLVDFAKRIRIQLANTEREPHWEREEADRYMAEVTARRERFEQLAAHLIETIIQPRLEILVNSFPNADLSSKEPAGHVVCHFNYCERFPATTRVAFAVEHDVRYENLIVHFEASMMPIFIKLDEHDRLALPLDDAGDEAIASWVEKRLLEFLDTYLRIDRGGDDFEDESVADPVCGMRIGRTSAAASAVYRGHPYFFCSIDCQAKFSENPTAFVRVVTM